MSALYKGFTRAKPVFFGLFAVVSLALSVPALAQISYTVEGVEVDVTAANAVKAREEALKQAQVKAFEQLALGALGEEGMAAYTMPDADTVMALVQDFEVTNEQLSARRYKGVFTVRFRPALAQQYLYVQTQQAGDEAPATAPSSAYGDPVPAAAYNDQAASGAVDPRSQIPAPAAPVYQPAAQNKSVIRARFSSVQEWVRLKNALERNRAFTLYRIVTLKPKEAVIELAHTGTAADLQQALAGAGLSVFPSHAVALDMSAPLFEVGFGGYTQY